MATFPCSGSFWSFSTAAALITLLLKWALFLEFGGRAQEPSYLLYPGSDRHLYKSTLPLATSAVVLSPKAIGWSQTPYHGRFMSSLLPQSSPFRSPEVLLHPQPLDTDGCRDTDTSPAFPVSAWKKQLTRPIGAKKLMSHRAEPGQQEKRAGQDTQKPICLPTCPSCLQGPS